MNYSHLVPNEATIDNEGFSKLIRLTAEEAAYNNLPVLRQPILTQGCTITSKKRKREDEA